MNAKLTSALLLTGSLVAASACPWCQKYGVKETVSAGEADPGGKFFGEIPPAEKTRHYYVAAEPVLWTFAPRGVNTSKPMMPLPPDLVKRPAAGKVRYRQYTDATFSTRVLETPRLGITGPVLRGVTGEFLAVTFLNKSNLPLSMHPHGVRYDKDSEGAYAEPGTGRGSAVGPGAAFTYIWQLDEMSGPQPGEPSSKCWLYHSHCTGDEEENLGLAGFIVVTDPARARADGTPSDVDREMAALFYMFDETPEDEALEYAANPDLAKLVTPRTLLQTMELNAVGMRASINGMVFGNLPGLEMRGGERVRWYLGSLGEETGMHTVHWHGARVKEEGRRVCDVITMLPGETKTADQIADAPGSWLLHCHVSDHMMEGMFANYAVQPPDAPSPAEPFLGLTAAFQSLRWTKVLTGSGKDGSPPSVTLEGRVTVYRGFYPKVNPPTVRVAGKEVKLVFHDGVTASGEGVQWRIRNANAQGVVLDEAMDLEVCFTGDAWKAALAPADPGSKAPVTVEVELAGMKHRAALPETP